MFSNHAWETRYRSINLQWIQVVKAWKTKRTPFYVNEVECPRDSESANAFYDFVADAGIKNSSKVPYTPLQTILSHDKSNFYPKSDNEIEKNYR